MPRVLAVDWGERRIGLAVSDPNGIIATGLETLEVKNREQALDHLAARAAELEVDRIVVGLPLLMSGAKGSAAQTAQAFADALAARVQVPVETYDERLTSALSARRLQEQGVRASRQRARIDRGAAIALLESFLLRLEARDRSEGTS